MKSMKIGNVGFQTELTYGLVVLLNSHGIPVNTNEVSLLDHFQKKNYLRHDKVKVLFYHI